MQWDRTAIFTSVGSNPPINFSSPSVIGDADITINDGQVYQSIYGFGGSLSTSLLHLLATVTQAIALVADSSALILNNLKVRVVMGVGGGPEQRADCAFSPRTAAATTSCCDICSTRLMVRTRQD